MVMIHHIMWKLSCCFILENRTNTMDFIVSVRFMLVNLGGQITAFKGNIGLYFTAFSIENLSECDTSLNSWEI